MIRTIPIDAFVAVVAQKLLESSHVNTRAGTIRDEDMKYPIMARIGHWTFCFRVRKGGHESPNQSPHRSLVPLF
jgi:hypothetical protein